jgi:predicted dehydrogenase
MHFALLGDHPDGLGMALALAQSGRHKIAAYWGPAHALETLRAHGPAPRLVGDVEDVLADPTVEAVLVAGKRAERAALLRRALQSERHVLCVCPADDRPDIGYEAAMLQKDAKVVLLPLLPEAVHPGVWRLAELAGRGHPLDKKLPADALLGVPRLLELERWSVGPADAEPVPLASLPGWEVLRQLGGEVAEVSAYVAAEELTSTEPVLLAGRFDQGGLFRALFLPGQSAPRVRVAFRGSHGRAELLLENGWHSPARLSWSDTAGRTHEERWETWNPWTLAVTAFESALAAPTTEALETAADRYPQWQDALRCLELDDAVRRSVRYRRVSTLEYPEGTEEVGFKGTMTLVGCGLLWVILFLAILASWVPWLGWLVVPALVFFLGLQALRWFVPREPTPPDAHSSRRSATGG